MGDTTTEFYAFISRTEDASDVESELLSMVLMEDLTLRQAAARLKLNHIQASDIMQREQRASAAEKMARAVVTALKDSFRSV